MADSTTESAVCSAFCVVYKLVNSSWVVQGHGWSQISLFQDSADGTYRLVGWSANPPNDVVLNENVTGICEVKWKSSDFCKFTGEEMSYGFGFYTKKEQNVKESHVMFDNIAQAIASSPRNVASSRLGKIAQGLRIAKVIEQFERVKLPISQVASAPVTSSHLTSTHGASAAHAAPAAAASPLSPSSPPVTSPSSVSASSAAFKPSSTGRQPPPLPSSPNPSASPLSDMAPSSSSPAAAPSPVFPVPSEGKSHPPPLPAATSSASASASSAAKPQPPPQPQPQPQPRPSVFLPSTHQQQQPTDEKAEGNYRSTRLPLGKLKEFPAKPARRQPSMVPGSSADSGQPAITDPYSIVHQVSVQFDPKSRTYSGLPLGWEKLLCQQFGLPATTVEGLKLDQYKSRIPHVLCQMKQYLYSHGGLTAEGVFRIAPDQDVCAFVKKQLNENSFTSVEDIHVISNLIKVWLRELPHRLLDSAPLSAFVEADNPKQAGDAVQLVQDPYQSILLWVLDLCLDVAAFSAKNKMVVTNLAVVFAPNLYSLPALDPKSDVAAQQMAQINATQRMVHFVAHALEWRKVNGYKPSYNAALLQQL